MSIVSQTEVILNTWPDSQQCSGCKNGTLVNCDDKVSASAYIYFLKVDLADAGKCAYRDLKK